MMKPMKRSKGQAVFEFIIAAVLFFGIVFYVLIFLDSNVSSYSAGSQINSLETKAVEISEYLVHINLTKEWPVLSYNMISDLDWSCNDNYARLLNRFGLDGKKVKLQVREGPVLLLDCERAITEPDIRKGEIERFALSENNTILNIRIVVW